MQAANTMPASAQSGFGAGPHIYEINRWKPRTLVRGSGASGPREKAPLVNTGFSPRRGDTGLRVEAPDARTSRTSIGRAFTAVCRAAATN